MASSPLKYECSLTAELLQKAEKELNEKAKWRDRDVQALRDMVLLHKGTSSDKSKGKVGAPHPPPPVFSLYSSAPMVI